MQEQLLGTTLPVLSISLDAGESVVAETGEFSWMTDSIQMSTGMGGGAGGHGVMGALKRAAVSAKIGNRRPTSPCRLPGSTHSIGASGAIAWRCRNEAALPRPAPLSITG